VTAPSPFLANVFHVASTAGKGDLIFWAGR